MCVLACVCAPQFLSTTVTVLAVVLVFCTTAAETAVGNWLYTYGVREVRPVVQGMREVRHEGGEALSVRCKGGEVRGRSGRQCEALLG